MSGVWPPPGTLPLRIDVVSVQSQVIYGRVGNNVAMPTFSALGVPATAVPTVLLSNTPHYASLHGGAIAPDWFAGHLDDLAARLVPNRLRAVQCGYLGSAAQARILGDWIARRRVEDPDLRVIVDPVIGDDDHGVYVPPELAAALREHLLPQASGLTPNAFELAHLCGRPANDIGATLAAARSLLGGATHWVAVTSAAPDTWPDGQMQILLVTRDAAWRVLHPRLEIAPKGTGDLFAASLSAHWLAGSTLLAATTQAAARVVQAMHLTRDARCAELLLPDAVTDAVGASVRVQQLDGRELG